MADTQDKQDSHRVEVTTEDTALHDAKAVLKVIESKTFKFIFWFITIGVALCFIAQFYATDTLDYRSAAEIWNVFVSLLLGIIATLVSLISLFFSFYNTKQSYAAARDSVQELPQIAGRLSTSKGKQTEFLQELHKFDEKIEEKLNMLEKSVLASLETIKQSIDTLQSQGIDDTDEIDKPGWENTPGENTVDTHDYDDYFSDITF